MAPPNHPGFPEHIAAEIAAALAQVAPMDGNPLNLWSHLHAASQCGNRASLDALATLVRHGIVNPLEQGRACPDLRADEGAEEWKESDSLPASHGSAASDDAGGPPLYVNSLLTELLRFGRDDLPLMDMEGEPRISLQQRIEALLQGDAGRQIGPNRLQRYVRIALKREPAARDQILLALAASGNAPLIAKRAKDAARTGDTQTLRVLLAAGVDAQPLLWTAAESRQPESIRVLLESGRAEVNATDQYGQTALHMIGSAFNADNKDESVATARVLLEHGADVYRCANIGFSAIGQVAYTAGATQQHELLWLLLAHGANPYLSSGPRRSTAIDIYQSAPGHPRWPDPPDAAPL